MPEETAQQKQQENVRWQTYSNRDYLNKIYVDKYEICIYFMVDAISPNPLEARKTPDETRQLLFKKALASLYLSFVSPRLTIFNRKDEELNEFLKKFKPMFTNPKYTKMEEFDRISFKEGEELLSAIAQYLYMTGATRTEKKESDPEHIVMEEMET